MRRLVVLALLLASSVAHAGASSVSILGVSGNGGPRFAGQLEEDLAELYEVLPGEIYHAAAERLGRRGASPDEVSEVCTSIRLDAIVAGAISGEGRDRAFVIAIREGASGRVIARGRYDLSGRTLPLIREKVVRDIVRALDRVRRLPKRGAPLVAAEPAPEFEPDVIERSQEEPSLTTPQVTNAMARARTTRGLYVSAGPAIMSRFLGFDVGSAPGYHGGVVAAIRADGLVFPLALSSELADAHPVLSSFGLAGSYERAYGLVSNTPVGSSAGDASRWNVMFVGRVPAGRSTALTIESGYQQIRWVSKSPTELGVPDVGYGLFDIGMTIDRQLGTPRASLTLRAAALALVEPGAIADPAQYGPATGGGGELDLGLVFRPTSWLWLRTSVRYTPLYLRFAAAGARFAHSALDQFVDATAEVGLAL